MHILILAHTPTVEKIDGLRALIERFKEFKYKICLITHTPTPQDIIDRCDYFIFDKENELNYDPALAYWIHHYIPGYKISHKQYNSMSTHIVPIMRMIAGALSYLKSLNIEKVCMVEYDLEIHNNDIFKTVEEDLNTHTISSLYGDDISNYGKYLLGIWGINLNEFDPSIIPTDSKTLVNQYKHYFTNNLLPATEYFLYDWAWSKYSIKWNSHELAKKSITISTSDRNNDYGKNSYLLHVHNDMLHFFCSSSVETIWNFDIIVNQSCTQITVNPKTWVWRPLCKISDVDKIKIFLDNTLIKSFDLSNQEDYDYIYKWVSFQPIS